MITLKNLYNEKNQDYKIILIVKKLVKSWRD